MVFATALLQTGSQIMTAILGASMGYFFDKKEKIWTLAGGLIMALYF